jgi:hypothetical protein
MVKFDKAKGLNLPEYVMYQSLQEVAKPPATTLYSVAKTKIEDAFIVQKILAKMSEDNRRATLAGRLSYYQYC